MLSPCLSPVGKESSPSAGRRGKAEAEGGANAGEAFDIEPAAVKPHDALGDSETETGALGNFKRSIHINFIIFKPPLTDNLTSEQDGFF